MSEGPPIDMSRYARITTTPSHEKEEDIMAKIAEIRKKMLQKIIDLTGKEEFKKYAEPGYIPKEYMFNPNDDPEVMNLCIFLPRVAVREQLRKAGIISEETYQALRQVYKHERHDPVTDNLRQLKEFNRAIGHTDKQLEPLNQISEEAIKIERRFQEVFLDYIWGFIPLSKVQKILKSVGQGDDIKAPENWSIEEKTRIFNQLHDEYPGPDYGQCSRPLRSNLEIFHRRLRNGNFSKPRDYIEMIFSIWTGGTPDKRALQQIRIFLEKLGQYKRLKEGYREEDLDFLTGINIGIFSQIITPEEGERLKKQLKMNHPPPDQHQRQSLF